MKRQRPFAGERNNDGSLTLWYSPDPNAECACNARPNDAHDKACPQAPRVHEVPPSFTMRRTREEHLRDLSRTIGETDVAERCAEAFEAFERRQARARFNPLADKLGAAIGR